MLKCDFNKVALQICCIFSEHLFHKTPLASLYIRKEETRKNGKKRSTLMYKLRTEDVEEYTRFLSVSSCFLLMVAILPFISTLLLSCETEISEERIFFILNTMIPSYRKYTIRHQYISIEAL